MDEIGSQLSFDDKEQLEGAIRNLCRLDVSAMPTEIWKFKVLIT